MTLPGSNEVALADGCEVFLAVEMWFGNTMGRSFCTGSHGFILLGCAGLKNGISSHNIP